jgi:MFS family permease
MFLSIGVTLAVVQGGYVRRKAHAVGEKTMAIRGLLVVVPGLILIGTAHGTPSLYVGLAFIAVGSAMATPCLTALVSVLTPATDQGRILGIFRSMGALARAAGPIVACVLYWHLGAATAYILGAAGMLAPVAIALLIPKPSR